ncbi:hypothetical protein QMK17_24255 [Rhodococcus sp. G-MC3]|uniref:hypothetical protein n=1 Tax=Rhodococcus sp. G-MC3 TaxID=3046209 RepID=UPI0024B8D30E|nr:hypothetical protein [Rhodococcus sp. G-MC3]MDJ0396422.1 hypothetical protein [Rhodococcus sp. G-MC3]
MPDSPSWIELMGRHAASATLSVSATVATRPDGNAVEWSVWHGRGGRWRVERDGQPIYLFDGMSAVTRHGDVMHRSRSDFHAPLLGSLAPTTFFGSDSLLDNMSRKLVPSTAEPVVEDGRSAWAVQLAHPDQTSSAQVVIDDETGAVLRFTGGGHDVLVVRDLQIRTDLGIDLFVWDGPVEDVPGPDREAMRRRARQVPWVQVLVQMVHGPDVPVRGVIRSVDETGEPRSTVTVGVQGGNPIPTLVGGVDAESLAVWKSGQRVRVERRDGSPVLISDGVTSWRFREGEMPTTAPVDSVLYRGNATELLARRPAAEWLGDDFTKPVGTIEVISKFGRAAYEFDLEPPARKPHPVHTMVDAETGIVLYQGVPHLGVTSEWTEFEVVDAHDDALFTWTGPSEPAEEQHRRQRQKHDDARSARLAWFYAQVTAESLDIEITISLDVNYVHELNENTGEFVASLGGFDHNGQLARRVHSDEPWSRANFSGARTWSSSGFDWVLVVNGVELSDSAFEALRRRIDREAP